MKTYTFECWFRYGKNQDEKDFTENRVRANSEEEAREKIVNKSKYFKIELKQVE